MLHIFKRIKKNQKVVSEHLSELHFEFGLSRSIWKPLEAFMWLIRVAELISYVFQTDLRCAAVPHFASQVNIYIEQQIPT